MAILFIIGLVYGVVLGYFAWGNDTPSSVNSEDVK